MGAIQTGTQTQTTRPNAVLNTPKTKFDGSGSGQHDLNRGRITLFHDRVADQAETMRTFEGAFETMELPTKEKIITISDSVEFVRVTKRLADSGVSTKAYDNRLIRNEEFEIPPIARDRKEASENVLGLHENYLLKVARAYARLQDKVGLRLLVNLAVSEKQEFSDVDDYFPDRSYESHALPATRFLFVKKGDVGFDFFVTIDQLLTESKVSGEEQHGTIGPRLKASMLRTEQVINKDYVDRSMIANLSQKMFDYLGVKWRKTNSDLLPKASEVRINFNFDGVSDGKVDLYSGDGLGIGTVADPLKDGRWNFARAGDAVDANDALTLTGLEYQVPADRSSDGRVSVRKGDGTSSGWTAISDSNSEVNMIWHKDCVIMSYNGGLDSYEYRNFLKRMAPETYHVCEMGGGRILDEGLVVVVLN